MTDSTGVPDIAELFSRHLLQSAVLRRIPGILHGFSTRLSTISPWHNYPAVRGLSSDKTGGKQSKYDFVTCEQVHSNAVALVDGGSAGKRIPGTDGLVTLEHKVLVAVRTADCAPVLMVQGNAEAVAALHAGWRGTLAGIAERAVSLLCSATGMGPESISACIGPLIGPCCFEVGRDVAESFLDRFGKDTVIHPRAAKPFVNLAAANAAALSRAGVPETSIETVGLCTKCRSDLFPSYRREPGTGERIWSFIYID